MVWLPEDSEFPLKTLRRLDSGVDQIFWTLVIAGSVWVCPEFFQVNVISILIVVCLEVLAYAISFIRFRREVATHAIASKLWTLTILAFIIQVMLSCHSETLFALCFYAGIITRVEIIAMLLILPNWTHDVPTVYHAWQLRQGKEIKKNKWFNG